MTVATTTQAKTPARRTPAKTGNPPADRAARTAAAKTPAKTAPPKPAPKAAAPKAPGSHSYVLRNGDFKIHKAGCKTMAADLRNSDYDSPGWFSPADQENAVRELWQDQIREEAAAQGVKGDVPAAFLSAYVGATKFHGCCELDKLPGVGGQTGPKGPSASSIARKELATMCVEALAAMVNALPADHPVVREVGGQEKARVMVTSWIHHLPADRTRWLAVLPKPDRSDWR